MLNGARITGGGHTLAHGRQVKGTSRHERSTRRGAPKQLARVRTPRRGGPKRSARVRSTRRGGAKRSAHVLVKGLLLVGMVVSTTSTATVPASGSNTATAPASSATLLPGPQELRIRGADISFTLQEEAINRTLSDNGVVLPIEKILTRHGANYARLRVWVNPAAGTSDLAAALTLAARAHAAGMKLLLDLHYSDTWADRKNQHTPAAWANLGPEALRAKVESYTRATVAAFAGQGTPVDMVQIGNEITLGFLWPTGEIYQNGTENWADFTDLLKAGIKGAKEAVTRAPAIMIHIDTGGDKYMSAYFFDHLKQFGVVYDVIGLSYYPFWHGSLADLSQNVNNLASRYGKDIVVAETSYPWTLSSGEDGPTFVSDTQALPDGARYPPTPQGQEMYYRALNNVLRQVPGGHGAGFFVWEPGWLPGVAAADGLGNPYNNLTLFDWRGRALPALSAFGSPSGTNSQ